MVVGKPIKKIQKFIALHPEFSRAQPLTHYLISKCISRFTEFTLFNKSQSIARIFEEEVIE